MNDLHDELEDQVGTHCGWLGCGKLIVQTLRRGRRKEFCSDTCRRAADRDYKRVRARIDIYGEELRKSQHHAAAYGRKAEDGTLSPEQWSQIESAARIAFARASTVVDLGAPPDRVAQELEALVKALTPLLDEGFNLTARSA